ncbi:L-histidine N(alpha)-methyltransferase [Pseudoalteromonas ruthenica]|uniref:L-histidine N(alpha)-methyltransferase n=1 Tax=Pseudoalteromonas ruthenica TaxID=151081 RepID=UPI0005FA63E8|nr:L-histidine N(alpha)-methyltransferase [Pseudoalteromonas ruthenica]TMO85119.1 L-histidine N(alpha)-methyltransferase [Pseudoalteromonas ruthenica]TMO91780.1 L-histidine N(alpha)-methyltransferase [Pseudoalteromonas ruthenica]TMP00630.1 L-histidine N(alpha)-methyltransferase [Pseudoalteromonas ruthenica]TMP05400.1 L-histidine N(alpha)-methyltransferase [Pseudoalteromonas ruthenica]TMP13020.1 L-histidine N(alpha)-methyltransferase [Pseudoalteromonas ruthenica]
MSNHALPFTCRQSFLDDVIDGLSRSQKTLPCKYLYDDFGAQLFEQITALQEYYLTRTELALLAQYAQDIVAHLPTQATVIEPGCGSGQKVAYLLDNMPDVNGFIPLEISTEMLLYTQQRLRQRFAHVNIHPLHGDFTHGPTIKALVQQHGLNGSNNVVFFPGSTLGNFSPIHAIEVLHNLRTLCGHNGRVLIGIDLIKATPRLLAAYDDKEGVTAAFNRNLLTRIARELGAHLCLEHFRHEARFNSEQHRVEMHLVANQDTCISVRDQRFTLRAGESIHTENSHKYTLASFSSLIGNAGLTLVDSWCDSQGDFALCLVKSQR